MRKYNLVGGLIWLGLATFIIVESVRLGIGTLAKPQGGTFPLMTASVLGILALLLVVDSVRKGRVEKNHEETAVWTSETNWKSLVRVYGALILYPLILEPLGFVITTFLFVLYLLRLIEPKGWAGSIGGAFVTSLTSYLIFEVWLQSQLPHGVIFNWIEKNL